MSRACWLALLLPAAALAHNPDTSYARCIIAADRVELRLTYDLVTLQMIALVDADGDARATRDELRRAAPAIERFLRAHVEVEIDGATADLGDAAEPLWPGETGAGLAASEWHTAAGLITFSFRHARSQPAREVALSFDFFQALTSRHSVLGSFEVGAHKEEVTFTEAEPDFLFDAAFAAASAATPTPAPPVAVVPAHAQPEEKRHRLAWILGTLVLLPVLWALQRCSGKSRA